MDRCREGRMDGCNKEIKEGWMDGRKEHKMIVKREMEEKMDDGKKEYIDGWWRDEWIG